MTTPLRDAVIRLGLDDARLRDANRGLVTLESNLGKVASAAKLSGAQLKAASGGAVADGFRRWAKEADTARVSVDKLRDAVDNASQKRLGDLVGRGGSAFAALGALAGGELGESLRGLGDVGDVVERIEGLKGALSSLGSQGFGGLLSIVGPGAALAVGLGVVVSLVNSYNAEIERQAELLRQETLFRRELADMTTADLANRSEEIRKEIEFREARVAELQARLEESARLYHQALSTGVALTDEERGRILRIPETQAVRGEIETLQGELDGFYTQLNTLNEGFQDGITAANDAEDAERELAETRKNEAQAAVAGAINATNHYLELSRFIESATAEQVQTRIDALTEEKAALGALITDLRAMGTPEAQKAIEDTSNKIRQLEGDIGRLGAALEDKKVSEGFQKLIDSIRDAAERAKAAAAKAGENIRKEIEARNERLVDVQKSYEADVKAIDARAAEQRAEAQKRYNDRIVDIAAQAADDAARALKDLQGKQRELQRDAAREEQNAERQLQLDETKAQIAVQRDEAKALREHYRNLDQIRRDAQRQEADLILNRDFAGLFRLRERTGQQLDDANRDFLAERDERRTQLAENLSDLRRNFEAERAARRVALQQQLADARAAYVQERTEIETQRVAALAKARADRQRELAEVAADAARQRAVRRQAYIEELRQASLFANQRMTIDAQVNAAYLTRANATLNALNGAAARAATTTIPSSILRLTRRDTGGPLGIGQLSTVNERIGQRERANGAWLPAGPGLFLPLQRTQVSPGGGSQVALTFNISGNDPQAIARVVRNEVINVMERVIN